MTCAIVSAVAGNCRPKRARLAYCPFSEVAGDLSNQDPGAFIPPIGPSGEVTFVRHNIAQDFSTASTNAGGVVFSESHAERFADMDGDRIPDMITGKRSWSEAGNNTLTHTDAWGAPVLYIYKTVRDKAAPGGAKFVPELVHNKSGLGSSFDVVDLFKDGRLDIVTATTFGTYMFTSKGAAAAAPKK
jgi:hypothetical protein